MATKQNRFYVVFPHGEDNQEFDTLDSARGWLQEAMDEERKEAHEDQEWPDDYDECGVFELVPVVKVTESAEDPETGAVDYALTFATERQVDVKGQDAPTPESSAPAVSFDLMTQAEQLYFLNEVGDCESSKPLSTCAYMLSLESERGGFPDYEAHYDAALAYVKEVMR